MLVARIVLALLLGASGLAARDTAPAVSPPLVAEETAVPETTDEGILQGDESQFRVIDAEAQMMVFSQDGNSGYQSQAGPYYGPGSERALIIQPSGLVTFASGPRAEHELFVAADIVSAASANAVDATSIASAANEAVTVELSTSALVGSDHTFHSTVGGHIEEPMRSMYFSLGLDRSLADDNASIGLSAGAVFDHMNNNLPNGKRRDRRKRIGFNVNGSFSQVLSPTTLFLLGYGYTHQRGTLYTTWNSVPLDGGIEGPATRGGERFPEQRNRHAVSTELAQHVPATDSTLRLHYRYYTDDFAATAHTGELSFHQVLSDTLAARTHYRHYVQDAVFFHGTSFPQTVEVNGLDLRFAVPRAWQPAIFQTADSDLAAFTASEVGGEIRWFDGGGNNVEISYTYYSRTNGLTAHLFGLTYAALF